MNRNTNLRPLSASLMVILLFIIHNKGWTQCNFSVDAGPDQTICSAGSTVQLNGSTTALNFSWSPVTGLSNPNALNPQAVVTQTTTYTLTAAQPSGNNLITNGDFSQGNSGFTSDYGFDDCPPNQWGSLGCEGAYVVTSNSGTTHSNFSSCSDHTSGNGNMMAVNGANNAINIWCQVISVNTDTDYDFSAWATSLVSDSPARLQFSINGVTIGNIFNVSPATCNWQEFSATWNSGGNTSATICVTNQNNAVGGNDFALDDISFEELCTVTDEVTVEVVEINGQIETPPILDCNSILQCIVLNGAGSSSSIPGIEYQWTASNGGVIQSGENTPNPTVCGEGTYTLVVSVTTSDGTVCTDDPQMVDVLSDNVPPQMPFITGPPSSCASSIGNYFFTGPQVYQNTNWFVIGDGILITDPEDTAAEVVWNSGGFGQVCLEVRNFCDIPPSIICHNVDILNIPETPELTGPAVICSDGNPVTYSIDNLSTTDNMFFWSPPDGSLIIPTGVDNVIMLLWDPNSTGGTLCVDVQNNCGLAPTECLTIAINTPLNTALDTVLCEGNTFNYNNTIYGNGNFSGTEIIAGYTGCDSLIVEVSVSEVILQNVQLQDITCDAMLDGTTTSQTLQNIDGCDSLTIETTLIYTAPLIEMEEDETCDETLDGTTTSQTLQNVDGCDSLTIETTLIYTAPLIEMEEDETCDELLDGMVTSQTFQNSEGCDSLTIETTLIYTAPLIEMEEDETCDELLNGTVTSQTFQNVDGCDSLTIETTLVYTPPVNEAITAPTCDPLLDGTTSTETIFSESNCDSVIITTTLVLSNIPVTENINEVTCDVSENGMMSSETITGFSGCDSVIIETTLVYTPPVNEAITAPTCDPLLDGTTSTETIFSESNCDSVIITTTLVLSNIPVTENINEVTCDASENGMMSSETITGFSGCDSVIIETTLVYTPPVNEAITAPTCDPLLDGTTSTETIFSESNCDSVIITTTLVLSNIPVTENINEVTCDASQNGLMSSETITGFSGCDSVIIETTLVYTPPVNEAITAPTCDPLLDGTTSTETIFSESNCDSVIITTTLVLSNIPVTENINEVTCDASQNGMMSSETIAGFSGCDSVIIETTLVYTPPVNEAITAPTCDPLLDGTTSTETIFSESSCDSVIITTTLVLSNIPVTENINEVTCDASQDGLMSSETIAGFSGCDSVIIETTLVYTPPVNEAITASTCDPLLDGTTSTETIFSESNCDSVIITTTLVLSNIPVTENINEVTCDASENGLMSSETITGFSGCDSVIIETTLVYTPPLNQNENTFTCDVTQDGNTTTNIISSQAGCDSIIITTTAIFIEMVTTNLTEMSCNPEDTGISSLVLTGYQGCDSLVVTEVILSDINLCSVEVDLTTTPIACGDSEGNISVTVNTGTGPFTVFWESDMTGPLGSVDIINRGDLEMITGLEAGDYTITVVSANGLEWSAVISLTQEESFTIELTADQRTNGFGVTCSDSEDGNIGSEIIGSPGLPVTYEWSNGQSGATLINVAAGTYTLTVTDAMGCSAVGIEMITGPAPIDLRLESVDLTCFGEDDGIILVDTVIGGSAPYEYMFSAQPAGPNTAWFNLSPGDYSVTVTDVNGCTGSQLSVVGTPEEIIADLGPDQEIQLGSLATLDLNTSLLPDALDTIIWNGTDLESCENCTVQEVAPSFSGSYEVIVVDISGCTGSDEINIRVIKDRSVYIPNAFSPNGDGNNDRFFISTSAEAVEILEMNVYNRWGALVFSSRNFPPNNPGLGWNGLFREKEVNPGVFVYYVKVRFLDEAEKIYSGDVTIMK